MVIIVIEDNWNVVQKKIFLPISALIEKIHMEL